MLRKEKHNRFSTLPAGRQKLNDSPSSFKCYWHVRLNQGVTTIGLKNDSDDQRPDRILERVQ